MSRLQKADTMMSHTHSGSGQGLTVVVRALLALGAVVQEEELANLLLLLPRSRDVAV